MVKIEQYSDAELIILLKAGNDAAFKEIFLRYDKPLYLYAYNKLGNKEEARDVVQDVFLWILNSKGNLNLKTTLSGYLYKSVLNKIFNIFKHNQILLKYADTSFCNLNLECNETDYLIREKDIANMIDAEIAAMPPGMREVYQLRRINYMTNKQIAEHLNLAESTVETQMKRALRRLKERLGPLYFILFL